MRAAEEVQGRELGLRLRAGHLASVTSELAPVEASGTNQQAAWCPEVAVSVCPVRTLSLLLHTQLLYFPLVPSFVHSFIPSVGTADWGVVGTDHGFFAEFSGICDTPEILREWTHILCSSEERVLSFPQTLGGAGDPKKARNH